MEWSPDTELSQMNVVATSYGGPMAIVRDSKEFVKVGGTTVKPVIRIFTASGHLISTINVSSSLISVGILIWIKKNFLLLVEQWQFVSIGLVTC